MKAENCSKTCWVSIALKKLEGSCICMYICISVSDYTDPNPPTLDKTRPQWFRFPKNRIESLEDCLPTQG